ncbi:MAG: HD domain-containing phosphohydrolase, partial [Bdellovibrionota bacterium]
MESLFRSLAGHSDYLYAHSLGVGVYSVMVGRAMDWVSPTNLNKLALAGMLHDIGLKEIDRNIINRPRLDWNPDEVREFETHPRRGAEALSRVAELSEDVLTVALQHHEDQLGAGYPLRLLRSHIHPMARLVA